MWVGEKWISLLRFDIIFWEVSALTSPWSNLARVFISKPPETVLLAEAWHYSRDAIPCHRSTSLSPFFFLDEMSEVCVCFIKLSDLLSAPVQGAPGINSILWIWEYKCECVCVLWLCVMVRGWTCCRLKLCWMGKSIGRNWIWYW